MVSQQATWIAVRSLLTPVVCIRTWFSMVFDFAIYSNGWLSKRDPESPQTLSSTYSSRNPVQILERVCWWQLFGGLSFHTRQPNRLLSQHVRIEFSTPKLEVHCILQAIRRQVSTVPGRPDSWCQIRHRQGRPLLPASLRDREIPFMMDGVTIVL